MFIDETIENIEMQSPVDETEINEGEEVMFGMVANCAKLNVRNEPSKEAGIQCEIENGTEVMIDQNESTDEWYKVYTKEGVEGFCMKKFILIQ